MEISLSLKIITLFLNILCIIRVEIENGIGKSEGSNPPLRCLWVYFLVELPSL